MEKADALALEKASPGWWVRRRLLVGGEGAYGAVEKASSGVGHLGPDELCVVSGE